MNTENKDQKVPFTLGREEGKILTITDWRASPLFLENTLGYFQDAVRFKKEKTALSKFSIAYFQDAISVTGNLEDIKKEKNIIIKNIHATNDTKLKERYLVDLEDLREKTKKLEAEYERIEKEANTPENKEILEEKRSPENDKKLKEIKKGLEKAMRNIIEEFLIDQGITDEKRKEIMGGRNLLQGQIDGCVSELVREKENDLIVNFSELILAD